jgi:hypothetical protein
MDFRTATAKRVAGRLGPDVSRDPVEAPLPARVRVPDDIVASYRGTILALTRWAAYFRHRRIIKVNSQRKGAATRGARAIVATQLNFLGVQPARR